MGDTYRMLGDCFVEHKKNATNGEGWSVGDHFREATNNVDDIKITVHLETCSGEIKTKVPRIACHQLSMESPSLWHECQNRPYFITITRFSITFCQTTYKFIIFHLELDVYFTMMKINFERHLVSVVGFRFLQYFCP